MYHLVSLTKRELYFITYCAIMLSIRRSQAVNDLIDLIDRASIVFHSRGVSSTPRMRLEIFPAMDARNICTQCALEFHVQKHEKKRISRVNKWSCRKHYLDWIMKTNGACMTERRKN